MSSLSILILFLPAGFVILLKLYCLVFLGQMGTTGQTCWPHSVCGTRNYHVHFPQRFDKKPSVSVSLAGIDVDVGYNVRVFSSAVSVTASSFDIHYSTWGDTKVYSIKFSWIACAWFENAIFSYCFWVWTAYHLIIAYVELVQSWKVYGWTWGQNALKSFHSWDLHNEFFFTFI